MIIPAETHWSPWQCIRCNEDDSQRNVLTTRGSKMISGTKWPSLAPWLPTSCWEEGLDTFRSEQPTPCYLGIIYLPHEHFHRPKDWHSWLLYIYIYNLLSALASLLGPFCFLVFGPRNHLQNSRNYLQSSTNYLKKNMHYIEGSGGKYDDELAQAS